MPNLRAVPRFRKLPKGIGGLIVLFISLGRLEAADRELENLFESEVRPLLVQHCIKCHGSDKQEGGLRLDTRANALVGGESGAAIVPGALADSSLISAVRYESFEMPPSGQLPADQIATLERWVESGAVWPEHSAEGLALRPKSGVTEEDRNYWAFQPLKRPEPPDVSLFSQGDRVATPIDNFVIDQLEKVGLALAPRAGKRELIRRYILI